jgi:hypothetical protein
MHLATLCFVAENSYTLHTFPISQSLLCWQSFGWHWHISHPFSSLAKPYAQSAKQSAKGGQLA